MQQLRQRARNHVLVYIGNPKAGSSIKHSLESAQARHYEHTGRPFSRVVGPRRKICEHELLPHDADQPSPPCPTRPTRYMVPLEKSLRCRWLIEHHLI